MSKRLLFQQSRYHGNLLWPALFLLFFFFSLPPNLLREKVNKVGEREFVICDRV